MGKQTANGDVGGEARATDSGSSEVDKEETVRKQKMHMC